MPAKKKKTATATSTAKLAVAAETEAAVQAVNKLGNNALQGEEWNSDDADDDDDEEEMEEASTMAKESKQRNEGKRAAAVQKDAPSAVVYIGHLPAVFGERELVKFLKQFGSVTHVRVSRSAKTGGSRGYAFARMEDADVAAIVADTLTGYLLFDAKQHLRKRLVCHVVPAERVHPRLFVAGSTAASDREKRKHKVHAKPSQKAMRSITAKLVERERKKREALKAAGIDYTDFPGYEAGLNKESEMELSENQNESVTMSDAAKDSKKKRKESAATSVASAEPAKKNKKPRKESIDSIASAESASKTSKKKQEETESSSKKNKRKEDSVGSSSTDAAAPADVAKKADKNKSETRRESVEESTKSETKKKRKDSVSASVVDKTSEQRRESVDSTESKTKKKRKESTIASVDRSADATAPADVTKKVDKTSEKRRESEESTKSETKKKRKDSVGSSTDGASDKKKKGIAATTISSDKMAQVVEVASRHQATAASEKKTNVTMASDDSPAKTEVSRGAHSEKKKKKKKDEKRRSV